MKKILFTLLISLFFISNVNAEVRFNDQSIKFINRTYYDFPFTTRFTVGENTSYSDNYVTLDDNNFEDFNSEDDLPKYLYLVYCGSTNINFETTNVTVGRVSNNGSVKGSSCEVIHNGGYYQGNYYLNRWYVDFDYVQDTFYGIKWDIKIHNTSNSIYYLRAESMFLSNELIQDFSSDYLLNELLSQNSNLRSELNEVKTNTSETNNKLDETNEQLGEVNDNITSSDTSSSQGQANSFFEGFESDDYGLSDIITMPLDLIKGLTSNTCVALNLTIPFVNKTFQLPCMSSIYQQYFGDFFNLYQTITFGFVAYWVIVKIFALVKGFKDPNDDKVEVLDL